MLSYSYDTGGQYNDAQRSQLCVRQGIWKMSNPELKPNKVTKEPDIFI